MSEFVTLGRDGGIATLTLANPPKHTLNAGGVGELHEALSELERDASLRVLVLTGGGEGVFVAHYEVGELAASAASAVAAANASGAQSAPRAASATRAELDSVGAQSAPRATRAEPSPAGARLHPFHELCLRLEALPAVSIAAINGNAAGGGLELALACDFRLAQDGNYLLGLPETSVGIIPGAGGTQRLTHLLGVARALDLILHARLFSPSEALALGVVHRVFAPGAFAAETRAFAQDLASRAPIALAAAKRAIREGAALPLREGLAVEQREFERAMRSQDAAGAMRAWLRGETWRWRGE